MSLVVVRKSESGIILVSDMARIEPNEENNPSFLDPQLKIALPFAKVALAFAGTIHYADVAAEQLLSLPEFNINDAVKILVAQNIASGNRTDFILALSELNEIYKIKDGRSEVVEVAWIGDHSGFGKFQQFFHGLDSAQPLSLRLADSMKFVISDPSIKEVSGFVVRADNCDSDKKFRYQIAVEMYGGNEVVTIPAGEAVPIPLGNAASGAHKIDTFFCTGKSGCTLGIFFEIGEFGFVWTDPGKFNCRKKISNAMRAEFEYQIIQECSLEPMIGLSWQDYFKAGLKMLRGMNFVMANVYCDRGIAVQATRDYIPDREQYFRTFFLKAEVLVKQNKFVEAEAAMAAAIQHSPLSKELHYYLGLIRTDLSDVFRALDSLSKAIEIDPDYADAYRARGSVKLNWQIEDFGKTDFQKYDELILKKI